MKLKPCQFCGRQPKKWFDVDALIEGYNIKCCNVYITTIFMSEAVQAWNNRPVEDALVEALERMILTTEKWLKTGDTASSKESESIYDQMVAAVKLAKGE